MADYKDVIVLGSGHTYVMPFTGTLPADADIEKDENLLGATSGGASVEYKTDKYTAKSDDGVRTKSIITSEDATLKTGIMTFCGDTIKKLVATGTVTTSGTKTTVKIGGSANDDGIIYVVRFVHHDAHDGDVRVTIVGKNSNGLSMTFQKDKETVTDAEFTAESMDDKGTLVQIEFSEPATSEGE